MKYKSRYSPRSAESLILDLHFLSSCNYLVCTFGSNFCRLSYELMQVRFPDGGWRFRSLDDTWTLAFMEKLVAIYPHKENKEKKEIELKVGDELTYIYYAQGRNSQWNGYSNVKNSRTKAEGLVPSYKIKKLLLKGEY